MSWKNTVGQFVGIFIGVTIGGACVHMLLGGRSKHPPPQQIEQQQYQ